MNLDNLSEDMIDAIEKHCRFFNISPEYAHFRLVYTLDLLNKINEEFEENWE